MSNGRAYAIDSINTKYAGFSKDPRFHQNVYLPEAQAPALHEPIEKLEAGKGINYFSQQRVSSSRGSKWLYFIIGTLVLAAIVGVVYYFWNRTKNV